MRLHHTFHTIPSSGAADLRHFYGDLLGLPEIPPARELEGMPLIWFQVGDSHLHFRLDDAWERGHEAHHVALHSDDLGPMFERLRAEGIAIVPNVGFQEYGYRRFYVHDPFGRQVELIEPLTARQSPARTE